MTTQLEPLGSWNPPTLKQYVDQRFLDSDKAVSAALQAAKEAVGKAELATDKRFDALADDADRRAADLSAQISVLQEIVNQNRGGTATSQRMWGLAIPAMFSATSIAVVIVALAHHW